MKFCKPSSRRSSYQKHCLLLLVLPLKGTREIVAVGLPYVVVYLLTESRIVILRVLSGAQNWTG
jgi:plasmid stabilization system protein ParE